MTVFVYHFMSVRFAKDTYCPQAQAVHIIQSSIQQHCCHTHERVQILARVHNIAKAQSASMYCNSMHHGLLFQHRDCSKHRPTDSTLNAEALQQYMHTHSQLSLAHKQLLFAFIHTIHSHAHIHTLSSCSSTAKTLSLSPPFIIPPARAQNIPDMIPAWGDAADTMINTCMSCGKR